MENYKKCGVKGCKNKYHSKGYCNKHGHQIYRYGKIIDKQREREKNYRINRKCKVKNCKNEYYSAGYCQRHYSQIYYFGKILERTNCDPNKIINCGEYYEICLYNRKCEEIARTKIDKEDLEKVKNYKWSLDGDKYVYSKKNRKGIKLHQLIIGKPPIGYEVDHKSGDKLDNRKCNLRFATYQQNAMNRKCKGYNFKAGKWVAQIKVNGKYIYLGRSSDEEFIKKIVQEARQKYFGEFAYKKTN